MAVFLAVTVTQISAQTKYVKATGSNAASGADWNNAYATLDKAVSAGAKIVYMGSGVYQTQGLAVGTSQGLMQLPADLTIFGSYTPASNFLTYDPRGNNITVLDLSNATGSNNRGYTSASGVVTTNFSMTGVNVRGYDGNGSAIELSNTFGAGVNGTVNLKDVVFETNVQANNGYPLVINLTGPSGAAGKAVFDNVFTINNKSPISIIAASTNNTSTIKNSNFTGGSNNIAGLLQLHGGINTVDKSSFCLAHTNPFQVDGGTTTITNSSLHNNSSATGAGGALVAFPNPASITVNSVVFYNNTYTNTNSETILGADISNINGGIASGAIINVTKSTLQRSSAPGTYSSGITFTAPNTFDNTTVTQTSVPSNCPTALLICNAGTSQVALSTTTLSACSPSTVNLNDAFTGTAPAGSSLVWFTNASHTGTAYATPTAATAGTYYAFFYDSVIDCYNTATSTSSVVVTIGTTPAAPGAITGSSCILPPNGNVFPPYTSQVYSVPAVPGATSYTWTYSASFGSASTGIQSGAGTNSVTINFNETSQSGTLSVTVTTACGTSTASNLAINVLPKPSIVTLGETTICPGGGSAVLTSTPAQAYQWYKDAVLISGATSQNYTATATGAYTVVTSSGSCNSVSSEPFNVLQQDTTPPVFVSPLGVTTKSVKIDFRNVSTTPVTPPYIFNNIEIGALANERVTFSNSTTINLQGVTSNSYPSTADATGPAAYGNNKLLFIHDAGDPIRTFALNFDQSVSNLKFTLFDIDGVSKMEARAYNNGVLQPITMASLKTLPINTAASASPSTTPTIIGITNAYTIGNITGMRFAGINVNVPGSVNSFILATTTRIGGDSDFYISQVAYDYSSPVLPADMTVNCDAIPAPVVLTATDNCSPATVVYTQTPATYTPSTTATNLVRKWVATDSSGNINTFTQTITVNPIATPAVASASQDICATVYSTLANITITGTNIKWYADATTTTVLPSTTLLVNGTTYYATQTAAGSCESSRIPVTVNLKNCSWVNPSLRSKASK